VERLNQSLKDKLNFAKQAVAAGLTQQASDFITGAQQIHDDLIDTLVEKYGTYTTVNGQIRAVYAPYFHRNPGRCFTTVCNENTACIRPYTAQNAVLYTVP
jgi:hypothetical protein